MGLEPDTAMTEISDEVWNEFWHLAEMLTPLADLYDELPEDLALGAVHDPTLIVHLHELAPEMLVERSHEITEELNRVADELEAELGLAPKGLQGTT
jgi:hypothetical protein